jgi:hypothetical protein
MVVCYKCNKEIEKSANYFAIIFLRGPESIDDGITIATFCVDCFLSTGLIKAKDIIEKL